jgi:hypothetical protein
MYVSTFSVLNLLKTRSMSKDEMAAGFPFSCTSFLSY